MHTDNLYQIFNDRYSTRRFTNQPVDRVVIDRILTNSMKAPSAVNSQPWSVVVVDVPSKQQQVCKAAVKGLTKMNGFMSQAPVHLYIVADRGNLASRFGGMVRGFSYVPYDLGIFVAHIILAATHEGLGSCVLGWINDKELSKELGVPKSKRIVLQIVIGYADDTPKTKKRKTADQVIHYNNW